MNKETVRIQVNDKGKNMTFSVTSDVADMLLSPTTDPAVKQMLIDDITNDLTTPRSCTKTTSSIETSGSWCANPPSFSNNSASSCENEVKSQPLHFWNEKEEDLLISIRHDRSDEFTKSRNHNKLWIEISKELQKIGCQVSAQQAMYKYSALKKKWKELVDLPSGSECRHFRHRTAFDNEYGTKASTKPSCTIDSEVLESSSTVKTGDKQPPKPRQGSGKRRRSIDVCALIQEQHDDWKEQMKTHQKEKMQRMDRLLDLYEREIATKAAYADK